VKKILPLIIVLLALTACTSSQVSYNEKNAPAGLNNYNDTDVIKEINAINNGRTPVVKRTDNNMVAPTTNRTQPPPQEQKKSLTNLAAQFKAAVLKTNYGDIKVMFYDQESPVTVNNFLNLAKDGFYDGTKFHRVIKDFMIQGGDPLSKDDNNKANWGRGGPGYQFQDEINSHPLVKGSLAMANSGSNTNGSQFFIVAASSTPWLDGKHTNFGYVVEGLDVVDKIDNVPTDSNDRPVEDVIINKIELVQ